jgi:hypothetical protein
LVTLSEIQEAKNLGAEWLILNTNPDGSLGPVDQGHYYYRAPGALASTGYTMEACMLLNWIRINMFNKEGDFDGKYGRGDYTENYYTYPNANLIIACQNLKQYDLAQKGIQFLLRMQDEETGGFYNFKDKPREEQRLDIWTSSQVGLACIATSRLPEAEKTAQFLETMFNLQPDFNINLYNVYQPKKGLLTSYPKEEAKYFLLDSKSTTQYYFIPGIAAAFLGRLYMVTEERKYLDLAEKYITFSLRCSEDQFTKPQVGKVGWGAAVLYQITKNSTYLNLARKVAQYLVDYQYPEGYWWLTSPMTTTNENELHHVIEVTAEFVLHLDSILTAIII